MTEQKVLDAVAQYDNDYHHRFNKLVKQCKSGWGADHDERRAMRLLVFKELAILREGMNHLKKLIENHNHPDEGVWR